MFEYHARVLEDASNKPDASTAYNLSGTAVAGHRTFASKMTDDAQCVVTAEQIDADGNANGAFEQVACTFDSSGSPDTLTRGTLLDSSTGSKIDWSASGVNATPRLAITDKDSGMGRVVDIWEFDSAVSSLEFEASFAAGRVYTFLIDHVTPSGSAEDMLRLRMRRTGQGSVDSVSGDYTYQRLGRVGGSWETSGYADTAIWTTVKNVYAASRSGYDASDRVCARWDVFGLGDAVNTKVVIVGNSPQSNTDATRNGSQVINGEHEFAVAVDLLELSWVNGGDFAGGRIVLTESA